VTNFRAIWFGPHCGIGYRLLKPSHHVDSFMTKIAIIGSGLAGLSLAHQLKDKADISLFDKSRGPSGRMSHRRAEPFYFDHGAQYFTARTAEFQAFIEPTIEQGVIERWNAHHALIDGVSILETSNWAELEPRYVGTPAMNALGKHLAKDLDIKYACRIASITKDDAWYLIDEEGQKHGPYDWVILANPPEQALDLLPSSFAHIEQIRAIQIEPCFALMLGFENSFEMDFEAAHIESSNLSWLANNRSKPNRAGKMSLIAHSSHGFAANNLETDKNEMIALMCAEVSKLIGRDAAEAEYKGLHRWLYANNATHEKHDSFIDNELNIGVCGDWTEGGRVEGAFTSALKLANALTDKLGS